VIYVATPHVGHHAAALTCLRAGKAVLCEKPLTLDRPTSAELVDVAREHGAFLMEAMWMRCNPAIRSVQRIIGEGAIGRVTAVQADFGLPGPFEPAHRLRDRSLGGGALLDLGVYPVSLAHLVLGFPASVQAWAQLTPEGVDENTGVLFGYDSGAVAAMTCGIVGAGRNQATIVGTDGRIDLPTRFHIPQQVTVHRRDTDPEVLDFPIEGWGYQYEIAEVQRCLTEGLPESPLIPHAATLEVMTLLDDIRSQIGVTYE
jgi:predicted dehydrogenase